MISESKRTPVHQLPDIVNFLANYVAVKYPEHLIDMCDYWMTKILFKLPNAAEKSNE